MKEQNKLLLNHLQTKGSITALEAMTDLGIGRLSARVFDLREAGYDIKLTIKTGRNRYGKAVHYGEYTLEAEPNGEGQLHLL